MGAQLALGYSPAYAGREVFRQRLDILRLAVNHLGLKEVAYSLDVAGSMLSDATNERDRKRWALEWSDIVKQMLIQRGDETALDLYRQLYELDGFGGPFAIVEHEELTVEQEVDELRRALHRLGDKGKAAAARVPRGKR